MYAVIETGGKQYRVASDKEVKLEKLPGEVGDTVTFDRVLMASEDENILVGQPYLDNVNVTGRILAHGKNKKIVVFKFKRRKGYRRKRGHRQQYTLVKITDLGTAPQPEAAETTE